MNGFWETLLPPVLASFLTFLREEYDIPVNEENVILLYMLWLEEREEEQAHTAFLRQHEIKGGNR